MSKRADPLASVRVSVPKPADSTPEVAVDAGVPPAATEGAGVPGVETEAEDEIDDDSEQDDLARRQALRDEKAQVVVQPPVIPPRAQIWVAQEHRQITVKGSVVQLKPGFLIYEERWGEEFVRGLRLGGVRMTLRE